MICTCITRVRIIGFGRWCHEVIVMDPTCECHGGES